MLIDPKRGYNVTATVRSQQKADDIIKTHPDWQGKVNFVIVADFTSAKPFDHVFEDTKTPFNYVIHTASPIKFSVNDIQKDMIEPAEMGYGLPSLAYHRIEIPNRFPEQLQF